MTYCSESPKAKGQPGPGLAQGQLWALCSGNLFHTLCQSLESLLQGSQGARCARSHRVSFWLRWAPGAAGLNLACPSSGKMFHLLPPLHQGSQRELRVEGDGAAEVTAAEDIPGP